MNPINAQLLLASIALTRYEKFLTTDQQSSRSGTLSADPSLSKCGIARSGRPASSGRLARAGRFARPRRWGVPQPKLENR